MCEVHCAPVSSLLSIVSECNEFKTIGGLAYDKTRYLYVADTGNNAIRRVDVTSSNPVTVQVHGL